MMIQKIYGDAHHTNVLRRVSTESIASNVQEKRVKWSEGRDTIMNDSKNESKNRKLPKKILRNCHFCPKRNMRAKRTRENCNICLAPACKDHHIIVKICRNCYVKNCHNCETEDGAEKPVSEFSESENNKTIVQQWK